MLQVGIVGLPNVGKSTLFNALTKSHNADAQNYPFCTIEPNVGVVSVPDQRLKVLSNISKTNKIIHAAIEFVDIAGLVAGASKGEGLGNKFLANIREVDAIVHVVRCFEDGNIIHTMGNVDPIRDIETINTELILADLQSVESQLDRNAKKAKGADKDAQANVILLERLSTHLNIGNPANTMQATDDERIRIKSFNLLTSKPVIYACNITEGELKDAEKNSHIKAVEKYSKSHDQAESCVICAQLEVELAELSEEEAKDFLSNYGVEDSGVSTLIQKSYNLLGLASYLTTGEQETRAWTFKLGMKAPQCAGVIHGDFEKNFIKAEVVSYNEFVEHKGWSGSREAGKARLEGKEYIFQDGDVALFRFSK